MLIVIDCKNGPDLPGQSGDMGEDRSRAPAVFGAAPILFFRADLSNWERIVCSVIETYGPTRHKHDTASTRVDYDDLNSTVTSKDLNRNVFAMTTDNEIQTGAPQLEISEYDEI